MMNPKTYLAVSMIGASFALPASASADTVNASASVRADAQASVQAFEKVKVLTEAGRDNAAAAKLKVGLRELRAAARTTTRMRLSANGDRALVRVVRAQRMIGQSADASVGVLADVVADADASVDVKMATTISSLLAIHQQAIDALDATIDVASASVDAVAVKAIVDLSTSAGTAVSAISEAMASTEVSVKATLKLNTALKLATHTVSSGLAILQDISADVSAEMQVAVDIAIGEVAGALVKAQATLQTLVATMTTVSTEAVGSIVLPTLNRLLGSVSLALSDAHVEVAAGANVAAR